MSNQSTLGEPSLSTLHFSNIDSFISYIYYLTSKKDNGRTTGRDFNVFDYDSPELLACHSGKSVLKVDKYIRCCVPSVDLEFILESSGISDYSCFLDPDYNFKHSVCTLEGVISEIFSPAISGDHFNPYIRFKSCVSSSSRSCSLLMDLVGLETVDTDLGFRPHDNIFLDLVCTFPGSVDYFLVNPALRSSLLSRMNKCRKEFFHRLNEVFSLPDCNVFGMSSSLHVWGSEVPILPHSHIHNVVPFFSYKRRVVRDPDFFNNWKRDNSGFLEEVFAEVDCGSSKFTKCVSIGPECDRKLVKVTSERELVHRFVVDRDLYMDLRLHLSNSFRSELGFSQCLWFDSNYPVDVDRVKELWSDIVYGEFQHDIMDHWELLDVHVSWIPWYKKAKLRSALQYKVRPPVLDLDLFFKKCPGVVTSHSSLDLGKVLEYLQYQLTIAIRCSDIDNINRYESLLDKAESIFSDFSESDIYSWLQFLSTWVTDTRVYGFWKNLCRYLLDPDHELLVVEEICPICGGVLEDTSIKVRSCVVDYVLVQSQNKYLVFDLGDPGG